MARALQKTSPPLKLPAGSDHLWGTFYHWQCSARVFSPDSVIPLAVSQRSVTVNRWDAHGFESRQLPLLLLSHSLQKLDSFAS